MPVKSILVITLLFVLCGSYSVSAADMSILKPFNLTITIMFHQDDLNQDGVLTDDELERFFNKYDTNHDGRLSHQEFIQIICAENPDLYQIAQYLFDDIDQNHDHRLEITDFSLWHAKMDADGNGFTDANEFLAFWLPLFEYIEQQADQHPHGTSHEYSHCSHAG